jgi:hypothetical protein
MMGISTMILSTLFGAILCYSAAEVLEPTTCADDTLQISSPSLDELTKELADAYAHVDSCPGHSPLSESRSRIQILREVEYEKMNVILNADSLVVVHPRTGCKFHIQIIEPDPSTDYKIARVRPDPSVHYPMPQVVPPGERKKGGGVGRTFLASPLQRGVASILLSQ